MFGRKEKAALAALPPQQRALAVDRVLAVAETPGQWDELFRSLATHEQAVHKHPLPPRAREILVPLVRVLGQDVEPGAVIGVTADLRGPDAPDKLHPGRQIQPVHPVTKVDETVSWDPWLVVSADLRNGAHLDITVIDVGRIQQLRKRSASGKTKWKTKRKGSQRIAITLRTAKDAIVVAPTPSPATQWLRVSSQPKGTRHVVSARAKYPLPDVPQPGWQLNTIMLAIAEVFRWVPPVDDDAAGARREPRRRRYRRVPRLRGDHGVLRPCTVRTPRPGGLRTVLASVCPQHTMALPGDPSPVCPECYSAARGYVSDPNDPDWAIGYRRTFYWEASSTTGDDTWWMTFDDVDRESFDDADGDGVPDGEDGWGDVGGEYGGDVDDDGFVDS